MGRDERAPEAAGTVPAERAQRAGRGDRHAPRRVEHEREVAGQRVEALAVAHVGVEVQPAGVGHGGQRQGVAHEHLAADPAEAVVAVGHVDRQREPELRPPPARERPRERRPAARCSRPRAVPLGRPRARAPAPAAGACSRRCRRPRAATSTRRQRAGRDVREGDADISPPAAAAGIGAQTRARSTRPAGVRTRVAPGVLGRSAAAATVAASVTPALRRDRREHSAVLVVGREEVAAHRLVVADAVADQQMQVELANTPLEHERDGILARPGKPMHRRAPRAGRVPSGRARDSPSARRRRVRPTGSGRPCRTRATRRRPAGTSPRAAGRGTRTRSDGSRPAGSRAPRGRRHRARERRSSGRCRTPSARRDCRARARREPALGVERCHAARAGRGDRLPVDVILHVAGGEHAVDLRARRSRLAITR